MLWRLEGRRLEGKESGVVVASAPVRAASSFPRPASSRQPRPMVVRTEARWPME